MSSAAPTNAAEYWDKYRPHRGEEPQERPAAERFDWTGLPGNGPGAEVLGDPKSVLDLGPAEGENAACLARHGAHVVAVDLSPAQTARARTFWKGVPGLEFVHGEACAFLDQDERLWEAIFSTWCAAWFTDPEELLPRVRARLAPGGVFAFSHREPIVGQYGAQVMGGKWLEGRETELTVLRWQYTPEQWADLCKRHGFTTVQADVIASPEPDRLGTLLVTARA
ncbi:class I SAM-dependent methyltransferase [Streptomyces sp. NRRL S-448]|uniref:class I SAM-dependent methyltransferase n=1 Tax=Streptomyces sp. NRRL S-448 TaxID=1463907 RepID=UPI000AA21A5F